MEQATRDFLIWIDAFCENVEDVPTQKQWSRVLAKIKEMAELAHAATPAVVAVPVEPPAPPTAAAPSPVAVPVTPSAPSAPSAAIVELPQIDERSWRRAYRMRLKELGMDDESDLKDFTALAAYNANIDPRKQAAHDWNRLFPGTNVA